MKELVYNRKKLSQIKSVYKNHLKNDRVMFALI